MRNFTTALAAAGVAACMSASAVASPVCLVVRHIDHTSVVDPQNILFHMNDGKVWHNRLTTPCPSLNFHGFVLNTRNADTVCSNQQTIRVMVTGQTCAIGEFTPYAPPVKAPPDKS